VLLSAETSLVIRYVAGELLFPSIFSSSSLTRVAWLGSESSNAGEISESPLGGNCDVIIWGGGVCRSSSWKVECRCLVRNPRPPSTPVNGTGFEEVDPTLQNNIAVLTATGMVISSSRRVCSW